MEFMIKYLYGATFTDNANEEVTRHEVNQGILDFCLIFYLNN